MRKYAYLKESVKRSDTGSTYKIMLFQTDEGFYLFEYSSPDAVMSSADRCYDALEDLFEEWNDLIDDKGWIEIEDPLPYCQHDAFLPVRVKGRDTGNPEWGQYEILQDGKWMPYIPL